MWTDEQWASLFTVLKRGFKSRDPWTNADENVYRVLLADTDPQQVIEALKRLVAGGQVFRPVPGELLQHTIRQPGAPTYDEMLQLARRALRARPAPGAWRSEGDRRRLFDQAAITAAGELHPTVAGFLAAYGVQRLRDLQLDDPDRGAFAHRDLKIAYTEHLEAGADRAAAALASGRGQGELARLDPLAHLKRPDRPAITEGAAS